MDWLCTHIDRDVRERIIFCRCGYDEMADTGPGQIQSDYRVSRLHHKIIKNKIADVTVNSRRRSSGGLRRNASHDITDQITDRKLLDLKKVASDESSFTEEATAANDAEKNTEDNKNEDSAESSDPK
ncbi:unnamed protein product [Oikopleura dioica]|uniref:Uncharacterized protein n=1 Tax=Oikopleura dioica TaxID=34765 RepID=E4X571_OIKDI|nr:unnamed protein product [Oikopleura dioica]